MSSKILKISDGAVTLREPIERSNVAAGRFDSLEIVFALSPNRPPVAALRSTEQGGATRAVVGYDVLAQAIDALALRAAVDSAKCSGFIFHERQVRPCPMS